jgi:NAD(P)-dependent dehydrogenase (short-subunit alcohol dehydrogenase family)
MDGQWEVFLHPLIEFRLVLVGNQRGEPMGDRRAVIVTGASRGLGAATARWLGKVGGAVSLVARSSAELDQVAADVNRAGGQAIITVADVADPAACALAVERTLNVFGRIDALVNNAGMVEPLGNAAEVDPIHWKRCIEVNLLGPVHMSRAAVSELRVRSGRIVNVSSGAAATPIQGASAYCASKAALNHFTRVLAMEEHSIVAVAVRPGVVDTAMQAVLREKGPGALPPEQAAYYRGLKEGGRLEPPRVPARSIAWLALHAPLSLSGAFVNYDDPHIQRPAIKLFGDTLDMAGGSRPARGDE